MSKNIAVIFAGGVGSRMGETAKPKQLIEVYEKPILIWTVEYFERHREIDEIYLACKEELINETAQLFERFNISKLSAIVPGGDTAQHSIYNVLKRAQMTCDDNTIVLIHDGVRPFISESLITNLIQTAKEKGNAITYTPCQETIIVSEDACSVDSVPVRRKTFSAQAPQVFRLSDILEAHEEIRKRDSSYSDIVDSCTLFHLLGREINLVRGNIGNIKITRPEDVYILKALLKYRRDEEVMGVSLLEN